MPAVLNLPTDRRRNSATHAPRRAALTGDYAALVEPAPDEITVAEAARILSCDEAAVPRLLRRHGLLHEPLTRNGIEELSLRRWRRAHSRWPNSYWGTRDQAAAILGVNRARVGQLVKAGLVPYERSTRTSRGHRVFRRDQLTVVANARRFRRPGVRQDVSQL